MTTMTMTALVAKYNELAEKLGKPTRKGFDNKTLAEGAIGALQNQLAAVSTSAKLKVAKVKRDRVVTVRVAGPRGFKFGPVWLQSIRDGKGVALKAQNMPKLLLTAQHFNVEVTPDLTHAEVVAAVAKVL